MELPVNGLLKYYCCYVHNAVTKKREIILTVLPMLLAIISIFSSNIVYTDPIAYGQSTDTVLPVTSVTASGNDGNIPSNAFDNNLGTRWSDEGIGSFIRADLGLVKTVSSLDIAWYNGASRINNFAIA